MRSLIQALSGRGGNLDLTFRLQPSSPGDICRAQQHAWKQPRNLAVRIMLTHRVGDARGRPAEHEDGHRDEHDEGRAPLLLLQGSVMKP